MQAETQMRVVPVQTVRMVQEEQYRTVPVSVQKPVVERVPNFVQEQRTRWEPQQMVRRVPVTTYKYVQEERVEQIPVRTCRMVAEEQTLEVPRRTPRWVAETSVRLVPRTVIMRIPLDDYSAIDSFSTIPSVSAISTSSYVAPDSGRVTASPATPTPADKAPSLRESEEPEPASREEPEQWRGRRRCWKAAATQRRAQFRVSISRPANRRPTRRILFVVKHRARADPGGNRADHPSAR